ncbi:hypothetical protein NEF87_003605 [Candidatus Lokiarchaeum ossiferum]|uniref:4'-phosphopantetheinyl transferase domain-containing protein n=1 Tax=Candidatus Lokiarchaeum ossiferum TaxID=2951803 RepID=A0ABY6HUX6_9ARCH|nr:hypothetical protein NEF87_003605 [Candidatus Lokiarchaeum sp. B-35]
MIELSPNSPIILLDDPCKVICRNEVILKYHEILYNGTVFYLGVCNQIKDHQFRQQNFEHIFNQPDYWHHLEKKKISGFLKKDQLDRLWEWSLSKILIKEGENEFFNNSTTFEFNKIYVESSQNSALRVVHEKSVSSIKELRFLSITHSSSQIFTIVAPNDIGIDCEYIRNISPSLKKKMLPKDHEKSFLKFFNMFFRLSVKDIPIVIWSIKESTLKALNFNNIGEIHNISLLIEDGKIYTTHKMRNLKCINFFTISNQSIFVISIVVENSEK